MRVGERGACTFLRNQRVDWALRLKQRSGHFFYSSVTLGLKIGALAQGLVYNVDIDLCIKM